MNPLNIQQRSYRWGITLAIFSVVSSLALLLFFQNTIFFLFLYITAPSYLLFIFQFMGRVSVATAEYILMYIEVLLSSAIIWFFIGFFLASVYEKITGKQSNFTGEVLRERPSLLRRILGKLLFVIFLWIAIPALIIILEITGIVDL